MSHDTNEEKKCKHNNTGNCIACYNETISTPPSEVSTGTIHRFAEKFDLAMIINDGTNEPYITYKRVRMASVDYLLEDIENFITEEMKIVREEAKSEEHQFFLNILDGIDIADEEMGNTGGGTEAIRFALKSRYIGKN